jgi:hypothetical protein
MVNWALKYEPKKIVRESKSTILGQGGKKYIYCKRKQTLNTTTKKI